MSRTPILLRFMGDRATQGPTEEHAMKYFLITDLQPGVAETPMEEWRPDEIEARPG